MQESVQRSAGIQRKWKLVAVTGLTAVAFAVAVPQASGHVTSNVPHVLEHVLEALGVLQGTADAIKAKTDNIPASPPSTSDTGTIVTDSFRETTSAFVSRDVAGTEGKQFLANFSAFCTFGTQDGDTDVNTAHLSLRHATPTGSSPFIIAFEEESRDRIIQIVTGPVAGFDGTGATYSLSCNPGGDNSFGQGMAQAWFQVLP